jgi:hypothetical protein
MVFRHKTSGIFESPPATAYSTLKTLAAFCSKLEPEPLMFAINNISGPVKII